MEMSVSSLKSDAECAPGITRILVGAHNIQTQAQTWSGQNRRYSEKCFSQERTRDSEARYPVKSWTKRVPWPPLSPQSAICLAVMQLLCSTESSPHRNRAARGHKTLHWSTVSESTPVGDPLNTGYLKTHTRLHHYTMVKKYKWITMGKLHIAEWIAK